MSLNLKDALELYQSHYELVDSIWAYFSTFALAVLGYTIGTQRSTQKLLEFRAMQYGFGVFSIGNLIAIVYAQKDLIAIANYVNSLGSKLNPEISVNPINIYGLVAEVSPQNY